MLHLNEKTRELKADSGYIHSKDDALYVDYPIYIAKSETEANYEEGGKEGYEKWVEDHTSKPEPIQWKENR